jgi:hypothetical protein
MNIPIIEKTNPPAAIGFLFTNGHDHNHFPAIARPPMDSLI